MPEEKERKNLSRSLRLRKYETVYDTCLKKMMDKKMREPSKEREEEKKEKPKPKEKVEKDTNKSKSRKRPLNSYQIFVREESQKSKYKGMIASERMAAISKVWKTKK